MLTDEDGQTMGERLVGKTAVVTGGGTGIGWAIARALAGQGAAVVIAGRREQVLQQAVARAEPHWQLECRTADVADRASVAELMSATQQQFGPIQLLVNSAGINISNRRMDQMRPEQWDQLLAVNATGVYNCMSAVLPSMRQAGDGVIINISSVAGRRAMQLGGVAYCASKFAATALGACVANEVAEDGVRVTNIFPGEVNTPLLDQRAEPVPETRREKMVQPEDFAELVVAVACLPPRAHVPELILKPTVQPWF